MRECHRLTEPYLHFSLLKRRREKRCLCIITCHLPPTIPVEQMDLNEKQLGNGDSHKSRAFLFLKNRKLIFFSWILTCLKDFEYKRNENLSSRKKSTSFTMIWSKTKSTRPVCVCLDPSTKKCILLDSFYCVKGTTLDKSLSLYFCYLWVLPNPFSGLKATGG
jgi:hypothetical protein